MVDEFKLSSVLIRLDAAIAYARDSSKFFSDEDERTLVGRNLLNPFITLSITPSHFIATREDFRSYVASHRQFYKRIVQRDFRDTLPEMIGIAETLELLTRSYEDLPQELAEVAVLRDLVLYVIGTRALRFFSSDDSALANTISDARELDETWARMFEMCFPELFQVGR